jgi:hypothetical protein
MKKIELGYFFCPGFVNIRLLTFRGKKRLKRSPGIESQTGGNPNQKKNELDHFFCPGLKTLRIFLIKRKKKMKVSQFMQLQFGGTIKIISAVQLGPPGD